MVTDPATATYGPKPFQGNLVGTDTTNKFTFVLPLPAGFTAGTKLSATATSFGGTSEFGNNVAADTATLSLGLNQAEISENDDVTLSGTFQVTELASPHTVDITWGDGTSETVHVDAGLANFSVLHRYLDDTPSGTPEDSYTIAVTVTEDSTGTTESGSTSVTVTNVAPTVRIVSAPGTNADASQVTLTADVTDPGSLDTVSSYVWTVTVNGTIVGSSISKDFTFDRTAGLFAVSIVTLRVTDDDTGVGADTASIISLTTGDDTGITLTDTANVPPGVERLVVFALAGNDAIDASAMTTPVELVGDLGNDTLIGGSGDDILRGDAEDDSVAGGPGNDTYLFIGSTLGSDTLNESPGGGSDTVDFRGFVGQVVFDLGQTDPQVVSPGKLTVTLTSATGFDNAFGGSFPDQITGNALGNVLTGSGGRDVLAGGDGGDTVLQRDKP